MSLLERFLTARVRPALGCTEPIAVALASAWARSVVGGRIRKIEVLVDPNIFKNGMGAGIPGSGGRTGNLLAAALGALVGDPERCLEVLRSVEPAALDEATALIDRGAVVMEVLRGRRGIFIDARVITEEGLGRARIQDEHTNLVILERNGEDVRERATSRSGSRSDERFFTDVRFADLVAEAGTVTPAQRSVILQAMRTNEAVAEHGLAHPCGLGIGSALQKAVARGILGNDAANRAKILTAAAVDARMGGEPVAVMAVAGSGNQGIACTVPLLAVNQVLGLADDVRLAEAAALAFLVTGWIKEHVGSLGAMCGCVVAAASGAAAGIARLMGGDTGCCARAVTNVLADLAGVICDGAKGGCALKLATAANAAVQSAALAHEGVRVTRKDGIIAPDLDDTVDNLGRLSNPGMTVTDEVILDIMTEKLKAGCYA